MTRGSRRGAGRRTARRMRVLALRGVLAAGTVMPAGSAAAHAQVAGQDTAAHAQAAGRDTAAHALVLSGGGARGIAHAGALVALEERGYTVPVVVGTSMGAIIGALYAAGYSPAEIALVTGRERWITGFVADPLPLGPDRVPVRPLLDLGVGPRRFYEGLLPAHGVNLRLVELLFDAGARARNDFDRLPRRFRAVAADLTTGREVALRDFDLPRAVRASMAVPGAFAPVMWRDTVLVDGGIANNLPVSVARALGPPPVIAIDVLRPGALEERAPLDVGVRALRLLIENARPDVAAEPDVLVRPGLPPGFSEMWFPRDPTRLLGRGYDAIRDALPGTGARPGRPRPPGTPPAGIGRVTVAGGDAALNALVLSIVAPLAGEYDAAAVIARTRALYATNLFQAVWPRLEFDAGDDAPATLVFEITPVSRSGIAAAARWDDDIGGGAWAALRHRVSLDRPVEFRATARYDDRTRRATLDGAVFSTALPGAIWTGGAHAGEQRAGIDAFDVQRLGGWLGAEMQGAWFLAALLRADHVDESPRAQAGRPGTSGWAAGPFLRASLAPDPDRVVGVTPGVDADIRFGDINYRRLHAAASIPINIGRISAAPILDAAWTAGSAPADALPAAERHLAPWLPTGALLAPIRLTAGLDAAYPFVLNGMLRVRGRAIAAATEAEDLRSRAAWRGGAEVGAAWPTVIGPVEAGLARGAGRGWRFVVSVGPPFR